jgi:hypothetical protein
LLYSRDASIEQLWKSSYYAIDMIESLELDETVGGDPDAMILTRDSKARSLTQSEFSSIVDATTPSNEWLETSRWALRQVALDYLAVYKLMRHFEDYDGTKLADLSDFATKLFEADRAKEKEKPSKASSQ